MFLLYSSVFYKCALCTWHVESLISTSRKQSAILHDDVEEHLLGSESEERSSDLSLILTVDWMIIPFLMLW